jgi:hypothetical protein
MYKATAYSDSISSKVKGMESKASAVGKQNRSLVLYLDLCTIWGVKLNFDPNSGSDLGLCTL